MDKQEILKLVNKGLVTACGLLGSEKIDSMSEQEFYQKYVHQTGVFSKLIDSPDELVDALLAGGTINLSSNINLTKTASIVKDTVLNLSDKIITTTGNGLAVENGATLTLNGPGTIDAGTANDGSYYAVVAEKGGKLIINGGIYNVGSDENGEDNNTIYARGGNIEIYGGEYSSAAQYKGKYWVLNCLDNSGGTITVYGGKYHNFDPGNNEIKGPGTNFVAEGYVSVNIGDDIYEVQKAVQSEYEMIVDPVENVMANIEYSMNAQFRTKTLGNVGYEAVQFKFNVEGPEGSKMTFKMSDSEGHEYEFVNNGTWGPSEGFPLPANYDATTPIKVVADTQGSYTVNTWLENVKTGEHIVDATTTVEVGFMQSQLTLNVPETMENGKEYEFTGSIVAGSNVGKTVIYRGNTDHPEMISNLYYDENGEWKTLPMEENGDFVFGPSTGFPCHDATSKFKVAITASQNVTSTLTVKLFEKLEDSESEIATATTQINITAPVEAVVETAAAPAKAKTRKTKSESTTETK